MRRKSKEQERFISDGGSFERMGIDPGPVLEGKGKVKMVCFHKIISPYGLP